MNKIYAVIVSTLLTLALMYLGAEIYIYLLMSQSSVDAITIVFALYIVFAIICSTIYSAIMEKK